MNLLKALQAKANAEKAAQKRAYHKVDREYLGLSNPEIDALIKDAQAVFPPEEWREIACTLWASDIYEARVAAGKLLTKAKMSADVDREVWAQILAFSKDFDSWAIADHVAMAANRRLMVYENRYLDLLPWTTGTHLWQKRAVLVFTLPYARLKSPTNAQEKARQEILNWAATYVDDDRWFIQKAIAWWLRELSKRAPSQTQEFLHQHQSKMKPFARKEAAKYL